ncbi:hypothetical protein ACFOJ6_13120 [Gordonia humi]|uniref:hypothetical protein n=1 Tax=Gordonia humi TaxID=686429 RepID=UPI0036113F8B
MVLLAVEGCDSLVDAAGGCEFGRVTDRLRQPGVEGAVVVDRCLDFLGMLDVDAEGGEVFLRGV